MQKKNRKRSRIAEFLLAVIVSVTSLPTGGITANAAQDAPEGCTLLLVCSPSRPGNGKI